MKEQKQEAENYIQLTSGKRMQTILYTDDQVTTAEYEDELQMEVNEINKNP
jgi:hypothetical protein